MIDIGKIKIGNRHPCFIIAEVAQAHDGSLGTAHAYIDAVAKTGADAIKFQTHIASEESSIEEPWRVKFSYQDNTRFDYWKRMEFTKGQWLELKQHAEDSGLVFLSSPFSIAAVHLLDEIGTTIWKVASGEINSLYLIEELIKTGKPIILSSGMSYIEELDERAALLNNSKTQWAVLECTTAYPTTPDQIDLQQMLKYKDRYNRPVGLSDHSGTIYPGLAAATLGADIIEVHVCFSKEQFGPDVSSSLTTQELKVLTDGVRFIESMNNVKEDKASRTKKLENLRNMFGKGIVVKNDIKKGEQLTVENIAFVKPVKGIKADEWKRVINNMAAKDICAGSFLTEDMIISQEK